jgi:hypothetical protein
LRECVLATRRFYLAPFDASKEPKTVGEHLKKKNVSDIEWLHCLSVIW